jgi:hypothetical protein
MKEIVLFVLILSLILIVSGYLEMYFDNKKIKNTIEYRFVPRNVYDSLDYNNLHDQFSYMFNADDARNRTNLV